MKDVSDTQRRNLTGHPVIRYLVMFVTGKCNLQCRYCYAHDLLQFGAMPFDIAVEALNIVASSNRPFHVQFTGGEPLLEPQLLGSICDFIQGKNINISMGVQTNGTLINEQNARMFQHYGLEVGLSIDGIADIHNLQRGRFDSTIRGLQVLAQHDIPCRVTTVVTEANVLHLDKLALMLAGFSNVRGIGLDLLVNKGSAVVHHLKPPSPGCLSKGVQALKKMLNVVNTRRTLPLQVRELNMHGRRRDVLCHGAKGESMAVLPNGSVYPCSQTAGDPNFNCGTVHSINWKRLRMSVQGDDCPSRTHYNLGENLILHTALQRETPGNKTERNFE